MLSKRSLNAKQFTLLTVFFCIWRGGLFLLSMIADRLLVYHPTFPYYDILLPSFGVPRWLYSWANFDGVHYLTIAQHGYVGYGLVQAFFPMLPYMLLHWPYQLLHGQFNVLLFGLSLTNMFAFLLEIVWFAFVKHRKGERFAWLATLWLFLFPTAFFFGALYTESLFLLATISAFWLAEKKQWGWASVAVGAAILTRIIGIFLIPALLIELGVSWNAAHPFKKKAKLWPYLRKFFQQEGFRIIMICVSCVGLVVYMLFLQHEFRDPLYFVHVQSSFGAGRQTSIVLYHQVIYRSVRILQTARPFDWKYFTYISEFLTGTLGLVAVCLSARHAKFSEFFFSICAFILPTLTGTFSSLPRYLLVCFPLYLLLANVSQKNKLGSVLLLGGSVLLLIINTVLFIQGYWVA